MTDKNLTASMMLKLPNHSASAVAGSKAISEAENRMSEKTAREIAESIWGTGGTNTTITNTKGAYYYSCSGHGGWVIDTRCFKPQLLTLLEKMSFNGKISRSNETAILFEEDECWCIPLMLSEIRFTTGGFDEEVCDAARDTFRKAYYEDYQLELDALGFSHIGKIQLD